MGYPAVVLHGGGDLNKPANNGLTAYRAISAAGDDDVQQTVLPRLDHYFNLTPADPAERLWAQVSIAGLRPSMVSEALDVIVGWAVRVLRAKR